MRVPDASANSVAYRFRASHEVGSASTRTRSVDAATSPASDDAGATACSGSGRQQLQVESLVGSRSPRDRRVQAAIGDVPDLDMAGQHPFVAAGASATCRRSRSNTSAPTMRSRALICCDSDGAAMCRRSAARPKWSSSATATK